MFKMLDSTPAQIAIATDTQTTMAMIAMACVGRRGKKKRKEEERRGKKKRKEEERRGKKKEGDDFLLISTLSLN